MKFLVGLTGNVLTKIAHQSVINEKRDTDAAAYNRADEFLSCSAPQAGLRWIKVDVPTGLPRYIKEFADVVYELDDNGNYRKTKDREVLLVTVADARAVVKNVAPWYTRKLEHYPA